MSAAHPKTIYDLTAYFGLRLEFIDDPEVKAMGFLDPAPEPRYIAVQRGLEPLEEEFTVAHELGHYLLHPDKVARKISPFYWHFPLHTRLYTLFVRAHRFGVHRTLGCESQANVYAVAALYQLGRLNELLPFVRDNLELSRWLLLVRVVSLFRALPRMVCFSFLVFVRSLIT